MSINYETAMVSVIIPNYNYGEYIEDAIKSVLSQTFNNYEIIVVNNGSTDNSLEVLQKYESLVTLINQENIGQSGARNAGLIRSTGDVIAFLDADDIWEVSKLEKQISLLSAETQLVYCGVRRFDNESERTLSIHLPAHKDSCAGYFLDHPGVAIVLGGESTAIFTRELLTSVGLFDQSLNSSAGWDFFRRCSSYTNFDFVPEPLVNYRIHNRNMSSVAKGNISDIRESFFKLVKESPGSYQNQKIFKTFFKLEVSFLRTHISGKTSFDFIVTLFNLPYNLLRLHKIQLLKQKKFL